MIKIFSQSFFRDVVDFSKILLFEPNTRRIFLLCIAGFETCFKRQTRRLHEFENCFLGYKSTLHREMLYSICVFFTAEVVKYKCPYHLNILLQSG